MTAPHRSLHGFVRRTLLVRFLAVALIVSTSAGLAVLLVERDRVSDSAVAHAVDRTKLFLSRYKTMFPATANVDAAALREGFLAFRQDRERSALGDFVSMRVWDDRGALIMSVDDERYELLSGARTLMAVPPKSETRDGASSSTVRIGGLPHLRVVIPIRNSSKGGFVVADALFAFSPETIDGFRLRGLRSAIGVALAALLTAGILYPVILHLTKRLVDLAGRILDANLETLEILGNAIAQRDSDTDSHNYRVTILCARIGEAAGLSAAEMRGLIKGAFLHDVGKIGIPDQILHKPGRLDTAEFETMKTHVCNGEAIVGRSAWLRDALDVVLFHHEKVGGGGYPRGLAGDEIPVTARIFAIADVFDALASKRPYKEPLPFDKAMEILEEGRGTHFDPNLLDAFSRVAASFHDRFGGSEGAVPREEVAAIVRKWFREGGDSLEY